MSNIVDIRCIVFPQLDNKISLALDTNVLLWTFYSRSSATKSYQKSVYPNFIANVISNGNELIIAAYNLNEMFHVIEKNEYEIYCSTTGQHISIKKFRRLQNQRENVKREIQLIYKQIKTIPNIKIIGSFADMTDLNVFADKYDIHNCDFFDFWLINYCNENNLCIVTDDGDFRNSFNKMDVYTANPLVV